MFSAIASWFQAHIHVPKWLASLLGSAAITLGDSLYNALTTPGVDVLSILTWKLALKTALGAIVLKAALWGVGKLQRIPTPAAPTGPTSVASAILLLLLLPLASCSPPAADAAPVLRSGPIGLAGMLALGDSLGPYTFTVGPVGGATGYKWTVTASATNGTWGNLPSGTATASPSVTFTLASVGGTWDSVSLQLCVTGTSAVRSAKAPACTSWKVSRYLASPTALTGDSSHLAPISLMTRASPQDSIRQGGKSVATHILAGGTVQWCTVVRFGSGHVAGITPAASCSMVVAANFRADRLNLSSAESAWLSGSCTSWASCVAGFSVLVRPDMLPHRA